MQDLLPKPRRIPPPLPFFLHYCRRCCLQSILVGADRPVVVDNTCPDAAAVAQKLVVGTPAAVVESIRCAGSVRGTLHLDKREMGM